MMGERLGKWILSTELGRGGMGRVYLATEDPTGRQAAVKVLSAELAVEAGFLSRFQREIDALSQLNHPHVVQFYDAGNDAGKYYYAMEYVQGESLDDLLLRQGRLHWSDVLEIALQICPALKHVHDHGIIHRDLKLSNVLVRDDGIVKLTDFGIAKVFATNDLTQTGGVVGTPEYLSPEQGSGKPVTKKSDIYSLGIVLYALLTGRPPFQGTSALDLMHKHRYSQFDRPGKLVGEVPHDLDEIVCQMLEKDPGKRPPDCLVLAKQLESIRMKLQRRDQGTSISDSDTIAQTRAFDPRQEPGPITLAERLGHGRATIDERGPIGRIFNNPIVLALMLAACLGTIGYAFFAPFDETDMFSKGVSLMLSDSLSDKETGWRDYLEPIVRRNPNTPFKGEIERLHRRLEIARNPEANEAWRFLAIARNKANAGDVAGATAIWRNVIEAFPDVDDDAVAEAQLRLDAQQLKPNDVADKMRRARPMLDRADKLRAEGKRADAERVWTAVEALYRDDPAAAAIQEEIRQRRNK